MGGLTSPSTKLVNLPPPGMQYPGLSQQFQGMLQTMGPQSGQTLGEAMKTGMPTDVGPAYQSMLEANKRGRAEGRANITEAFGSMGLRGGSPLVTGLVDYELQGQKDMAQVLAEYTRQASEAAAGRRMQASMFTGTQFGEAATSTYPTAALASGASPLSQGSQAGMSALAMMVAFGLI